MADNQDSAPYAAALRANSRGGWTRWAIPAHQDQPQQHPALAGFAGPELLAMDIPMFTEGVDRPAPGHIGPTPLQQAFDLAARAWRAKRTWFLTDGASQGNHAACLAVRMLGTTAVAQRSVHTSVIDGAILAGLRLEFVSPTVDARLGIAHGITAEALDEQLGRHPDAAAAYVVAPSYFGAVADVRSLADVCHRRGVPLIVDEAWGSHFGFHPALPPSALQTGADVVISSTHKLAGSLTQSAMLHLADGPFTEVLEPLLDRALRTFQTTSPSAILFGSLDLARQDLMTGQERITASIADTDRVRALLGEGGRFADPAPAILAAPDVVGMDPLHVVVDTLSGGVPGYLARRMLEQDSRIHIEVATDAVIVGIVGAGSRLDADYVAAALHALPEQDLTDRAPVVLPPPCPREMDLRAAYLADNEVVDTGRAIGRVSADALAAYPPGVANVLPGEVITSEVAEFLRATAESPYGWVRGALDEDVSRMRVVVP